MSVKAVTWALEQRVHDPRAHLLLINLANFANDEHKCFPGQPLLAERIGRSVDTVQRLLKKLIALGFIESERRNGSLGYRSSNLYRLKIEVSVGLIPPPSSSKNPKPQNRGIGSESQSRNSAEPKPQLHAEPKPHVVAVGNINNPQELSSLARAKNIPDLKVEAQAVEGRPQAIPNKSRRARHTAYSGSPAFNAWLKYLEGLGHFTAVSDMKLRGYINTFEPLPPGSNGDDVGKVQEGGQMPAPQLWPPRKEMSPGREASV